MVIQEHKETKSSWIALSLFLHICALTGLFISQRQTPLFTQTVLSDETPKEQNQTAHHVSPTAPTQQQQTPTPKKKLQLPKLQQQTFQTQKKEPKPEELQKPFIVPAPVVFYGNQAMMNAPKPIKGSKEGTSGFEHTPSALPSLPVKMIRKSEPESASTQKKSTGEQAEESLGSEKNSKAPHLPNQKPITETVESALKKELIPHQTISESASDTKQPATEPTIQKIQSREKTVSTTIQEVVIVPQNQPLPTIQTSEDTNTTKTAEVLTPTEIITQKTSLATHKNSQKNSGDVTQSSTPNTKKNSLSLAQLFKNARQDLHNLTMQGAISAKKAGTETGSDDGSGHQVVIKEGDMKYYTLWAKFLNHLNQAARFNRRGKERLIQEWVATEQIRYVFQCGITVDLQGKVIDVEINHSSGSKKFDDFCLSDIYSAVPYPPLPPSIGKTSARFEVNVYP